MQRYDSLTGKENAISFLFLFWMKIKQNQINDRMNIAAVKLELYRQHFACDRKGVFESLISVRKNYKYSSGGSKWNFVKFPEILWLLWPLSPLVFHDRFFRRLQMTLLVKTRPNQEWKISSFDKFWRVLTEDHTQKPQSAISLLIDHSNMKTSENWNSWDRESRNPYYWLYSTYLLLKSEECVQARARNERIVVVRRLILIDGEEDKLAQIFLVVRLFSRI